MKTQTDTGYVVREYDLSADDLALLLQEPAFNKYAAIAAKGLTQSLKEYYAATGNTEKVLILKAILDNVPFVELKRFAKNGSRLFAMCEGEYDLPSSDEFPGNLCLARKLMANGYDVYMLGNPNGVKSADFIATTKGRILYLEGKTMNGKGSLDELLDKAATQSEHILIDIIGTDDAAYVAKEIRRAFEKHRYLQEVFVLKGSRIILTTRRHLSSHTFERDFLKIWNGKK